MSAQALVADDIPVRPEARTEGFIHGLYIHIYSLQGKGGPDLREGSALYQTLSRP